jgi:hypothetical protein
MLTWGTIMPERERDMYVQERRVVQGVFESAHARIEARYAHQSMLLITYESWLEALATDFETLTIEQLLSRIGPGEDHPDIVLFPRDRKSRISMVLQYQKASKILYLVFVSVDFESYETEFTFKGEVHETSSAPEDG